MNEDNELGSFPLLPLDLPLSICVCVRLISTDLCLCLEGEVFENSPTRLHNMVCPLLFILMSIIMKSTKLTWISYSCVPN
jgi:3-deoxy-D-manno-octulosonic-acid transferase